VGDCLGSGTDIFGASVGHVDRESLRFLSANEAAALFQYRQADVVGLPLDTLITPAELRDERAISRARPSRAA